MSDPVSKVDIEDVLSSIRRLVSNEDRPRQADSGLASSDQNTPLLLTSAQRVCPSHTARDGAEGANGTPQFTLPSRAPAVTGDDHIGGPAAGGVCSPGQPAPFSIDGEGPLQAPALVSIPEDCQHNDGASPGQETSSEIDSASVPAPPGQSVGADAAGNHVDDTASCDSGQTVSDQRISNGGTNEATACTAPEHEPDCPSNAYLPEPERLRELVVEIVREELNGVLGDRITQNVRKLVRREIHRVLTIQDLDPT
jgi:cell pole-organizing protein PopZ